MEYEGYFNNNSNSNLQFSAITQNDLDVSNLRREIVGAISLIFDTAINMPSPPQCSLYSLLVITLKAESTSIIFGKMGLRITSVKNVLYNLLGDNTRCLNSL